MSNPPSDRRHFKELDALRGLAALVVVTYHLLTLAPTTSYQTFNPLCRGHESVLLFFVLSGFVLGLGFYERGRISYLGFLIRRVFRIYVPYLASIVLATAVCVLVLGSAGAHRNPRFQPVWAHLPDVPLLLQHVLLIGNFNDTALNPVIWSLVHEMRISLIFPLIVLLTRKVAWPWLLLASGALSVAAIWLAPLAGTLPFGMSTLLPTAHYTGLFVLGALLAKHHRSLSERYARLPTPARFALALCAWLCFEYANVVLLKLHINNWLNDWPAALGAGMLIVAALGSRRLSRVLVMPGLGWLGRISYSLYLFHETLMLGMFAFAPLWLPLWLLQLAIAAVSLGCATLAYHVLEKPSIRWGRTLAARLEAPAPQPPHLEEEKLSA